MSKCYYVVWTGGDNEGFEQYSQGLGSLKQAENCVASLRKYKTEPGLAFMIVEKVAHYYNEFPKDND